LKCHSDCGTCTGPNANQCTSCFDSSKTLVNNSCICNVNLNYFYVVGSNTTCQIGCPYCTSAVNQSLCYYRDFLTATCVNPPTVNCSAPYQFGDSDQINNFYGTCVESCGVGFYAVLSSMTCTSSCSNFGLFNYQGGTSTWTCLAKCPNGLIADPSTSSCVIVCPSTTIMYFWQL
jgi:proprotein convertase subtilisin/kexin type 5